jgi:hypothetical protein
VYAERYWVSTLLDTATLADRLTSDERLVNLDGELVADLIFVGSHHSSAELVEKLKRGLVSQEGSQETGARDELA